MGVKNPKMLRTSYKYGPIVYESAMKLEEGKTLFDERLVLAGDIKYPSITFCPRTGNKEAYYKVIIICRKATSEQASSL